jgi:hypothetical protein
MTEERAGLGRLKPDVLAFDGPTAVLIADAKYKRLEDRWPDRPQGVDRADLYQLTSYLARYSPNGEALGLLVYPRDEQQQRPAVAEAKGPWRLQAGGQVRFGRIGVQAEDAIPDLRELVEDAGIAGLADAHARPRWPRDVTSERPAIS